jgi:AcrR family transcriptional regulator
VAQSLPLRDRKRLDTRLALSRAAINLALETGGAEALSIDSIVERANVSRRTFFNYFPTKEASFTWPLAALAIRYLEALESLPPDLPIWDALQCAATTTLTDPDTELKLVGAAEQVLTLSPALIGVLAADRSAVQAMHAMRRRFGQEVARRTGTNLATDLYPQLMSECAGIAVRVAVRRATEQGGDPARHVQDVFALLRAGVPQPPPG